MVMAAAVMAAAVMVASAMVAAIGVVGNLWKSKAGKSQHASRPPGCARDPIDDIAYQAKFCGPAGLQMETSRLGVIRQIEDAHSG
jgi:hypothetical protein